MLETVAMALFVLWVIGLVTGNSLAGAIHVLLLAGLVAFYFHRRAVSRARSNFLTGSSRGIANAMGGATQARKSSVRAKAGSRASSRPSAAA